MIGYTILKPEKLHDSLKGKPRWIICVFFTVGLLLITASAVAAGVFIGYTYCYVEHRIGFRTAGNISQTQDIRIFEVPLGDVEAIREQNSINGALLSSEFVRRILNIGDALLNDHNVNSQVPHSGKHEREI